MRNRVLILCGIVSSLLYVAMNIFIPMLWPAYSSVSQTVSELSAIGAPTRAIWVPFGFVYTILFIAFGWGVCQNARLRAVGILIIIYGVVSLGWPFAPMHLREVIASGGATISDTMHIAFAAVTVLIMFVTIGFGAAMSGTKFKIYSIATLVIFLVCGALTALEAPGLDANMPTPWIGVWERINIGAFLLWVVVFAISILQNNYEPVGESFTG